MNLKLSALLIAFILFIISLSTVFAQLSDEKTLVSIEKVTGDSLEREKILLKSRHFVPERGLSPVAEERIREKAQFFDRVHVLIQFDKIPTNEEKRALEEKGVKLLSYIPNKAWFATIPSEDPAAIAALPNVRAIESIEADDKISYAVKNKNYVKKDGAINLSILFFNDVDLESAALAMEAHGEVIEKLPYINGLKLRTEESFIPAIANEETVQWIDVIDKVLQEHNDGSRGNIGVDVLQASPYNLSGINVVTAEWDGGWVDTTHDDLQGRVTIGDTGSSVGDHATHVAGTMLGEGTLSETEGGTALQWRGMAPQATVISYEWWDDSTELNDEYDNAINTHDASLSQNSWGYEYFGCANDCSGGYDSYAAELDGIVRGSKGKKISQIWSAGNKRPNDCDNGDYDCIGLPGTAKNVITVGATNSNDDSMTSFSSWGPTNDGRLKPEVTAPGCQVGGDGGITSTVPTDTYDTYCGTSMSAPATSGVIALMLEEFASGGTYPLPSTVKAILIHTAMDLGNTGPDYSFGYGRINATTAIDKIKEDTGTDDVIKEESISQAESNEFDMTVPDGQSYIKVTLVWDDYQATANADPALVNNLDILLIAPNETIYYPWVLDPNNPGNPATTGTNNLDNMEQVYVTNPQAGIWKVQVNGSSVPNSPQTYSLVSDFTFSIKPDVDVKTFRDSSYSQENKFFDNEETVFIQANITAGGQPLEGNTVTADLILSDDTVEDSLTLNEIGNGIYRNSWDSSGHNIDVYLIDVTVTGNVSGSGTSQFHLYSGSGVSAYEMDVNGDGLKDFVLENKHLISAFETGNKLISFLFQKDTNVTFNFRDISDSNSFGRGEISTQNLKDLNIISLNFSAVGENLSTSTLVADINVSDPTEEFLCPSGSNECTVANGYFFKNGTDQIECTTTYTADDGSQVQDCSFSTTQDGGAGAFMQCEFDISEIPIGSTLNKVTEHINMEINLFNNDTAGTFELRYFDCSTGSYVSGETVQFPGGSGGEKDFFSQNYASTFSWWEQCSGTLKFRWYLNTNWVGSTDYDYLDMCSLKVSYFLPAITTNFDLNIEMGTDEVDYLVYKLFNFDEFVDDVNDLFSPIAGTLGASVSDDSYHLQDGSDDSITTLTADQWNDFDSNYVAIYDNSTASDSVNDNVIAWVKFKETGNTVFDETGLWYDSSYSSGGLRIKYDTTQAQTTDSVEYMVAFTKGDYNVIDQWISYIESGSLPSPNFMTPPSGEIVSITLTVCPGGGSELNYGSQDPGAEDVPIECQGASDGAVTVTVDGVTNVNVDISVSGTDYSGPGTEVIEVTNTKYDTDSSVSGASTLSSTYTTVWSNQSAGFAGSLWYWLTLPSTFLPAGTYQSTYTYTATKSGS